MSGSGICATPECDEEVSSRSSLPHCKNCRASMGSWKRRGIKAILERRSRLKKYDSRMEMLVGPKAVKSKAKAS